MAVKVFLSDLDLRKNQLMQARIENVTAFPANAREGQVVYETATRRLYFNLSDSGDTTLSTAWYAPGTITAGAGLTKSGDEVFANVDDETIQISGDTLEAIPDAIISDGLVVSGAIVKTGNMITVDPTTIISNGLVASNALDLDGNVLNTLVDNDTIFINTSNQLVASTSAVISNGLNASDALNLTGNTLNVLVDGASILINTSNQLTVSSKAVISNSLIASNGLEKTGNLLNALVDGITIDFNTSNQMAAQTATIISNGLVVSGDIVKSGNMITVDSSTIVSNGLTASDALDLTGGVLNVLVDGTTVLINASNRLEVSSASVVQASNGLAFNGAALNVLVDDTTIVFDGSNQLVLGDDSVTSAHLATTVPQYVLEQKFRAGRSVVISQAVVSGTNSVVVSNAIIAVASINNPVNALTTSKGVYVGAVTDANDMRKVVVRETGLGDNPIEDGNGGQVYARLISAAGYTLEFFKEDGTTHTFTTNQNIDAAFVEVFDLNSAPESLDLTGLGWAMDMSFVDHNHDQRYFISGELKDASSLPDGTSLIGFNNTSSIVSGNPTNAHEAIINIAEWVEVKTDKYVHLQSSPANAWTVTHNLQTSNAIIQVYSNGHVVDTEVEVTNTSVAMIRFNESDTGKVVVIG